MLHILPASIEDISKDTRTNQQQDYWQKKAEIVHFCKLIHTTSLVERNENSSDVLVYNGMNGNIRAARTSKS